jgi:hypothetical protein
MDVAIVARYGATRGGLYEQGYKVFNEAFALFETLKREGKLTSYEAFGLSTGDTELITGIVILKGPEAAIRELPGDPRIGDLISKATLTTSHFSMDFAVHGETLMQRAALTEKISKQLHLVPA